MNLKKYYYRSLLSTHYLWHQKPPEPHHDHATSSILISPLVRRPRFVEISILESRHVIIRKL